MERILWISLGLVFYTYLGYGVILYLLVILRRLVGTIPKLPENYEPFVTLVIPCYNESDIFAAKIQNCKALDYPSNKLKMVFITDGSTDGSEHHLKAWPEITVYHEQRRAGKTAAENRVMKFVETPVVIFSDANTMLNTGAVRNMVKHFSDDRVGCVSGEKKIISESSDNASAAGEGIYWKYESFLKRLDSELYSAVGAAGELVAFRTSLYRDLPEDTLLDDFMQSMQIAAGGSRIVYESDAYATESASENVHEELKRKVRICTGGWQSMVRLSGKLSLIKTPTLYFQYISHRVLRWTIAPFLLLIVFMLNVPLAFMGDRFYVFMMIAQLTFYLAAFTGLILENRKLRFKLLFVPYYFFIMNYAVLAGLVRYLTSRQVGTWEKAERKKVSLTH
ncbi:MAG: glycosyltransferase family 2 protein [Chitinophagaceae bacterium]